MTEATRALLEPLLRQLFGDPDLRLDPGLGPGDVPGWDSLAHATLLLEVERLCGRHLPGAALSRARTVADLAALLEAND
jgi:acyl carrier protein